MVLKSLDRCLEQVDLHWDEAIPIEGACSVPQLQATALDIREGNTAVLVSVEGLMHIGGISLTCRSDVTSVRVSTLKAVGDPEQALVLADGLRQESD